MYAHSKWHHKSFEHLKTVNTLTVAFYNVKLHVNNMSYITEKPKERY